MANVPHDAAAGVPNPADKAEALYKDYLAGGSDAAYASLKKDYEASAGMQNRDQYWSQVASDLQASGHMPNIAIGWLKAEKDELSGGDGVISKQDIRAAQSHGGLDAIFGNCVLSNVPSPGDNKTFFDQVAHTKKAWSQDADGIEDADLRKYGRQMHRAQRTGYEKDTTAEAAAPLYANDGALLKALDSDNSGFITRHEMRKYIDNYQQMQKENPGAADEAYNPGNVKWVNEVLKGEVGRISNHPYHGFDVDRLERRSGGVDNIMNKLGDEDAGKPMPMPVGDKPPASKPDVAPPGEPAEGKDGAHGRHRMSEAETELATRRMVDKLSAVQPNEGYNAVAARLLGIHNDHVRTKEEMQEIFRLGEQIKKVNGNQSTLRLHTGVVLPVSANLELLMEENPALKASMKRLQASFQPEEFKPQPKQTAKETEVDDAIPGC